MQERISAQACAKVNISLDIISKADDGYHNLKSIMQSVGLCDDITIDFSATPASHSTDITLESDIHYIPNDGRNIAVKAAKCFFAHTGIKGVSINIKIIKRIPVCAGLGGGSADAACVLRVLNEYYDRKLNTQQLEKIAYEVGADVPFCIQGGTKLAQGRGEILQELPALPQCAVIICKPPYSTSTRELFSRVDCRKIHIRPDTDGIISAIESGSLTGVAKRMYNVFEDIIFQGIDEINAIKSSMHDNGALGTVMTGTGPAVIGIFDDNQHAEKAHGHLLRSYKDCYLTCPSGQIKI